MRGGGSRCKRKPTHYCCCTILNLASCATSAPCRIGGGAPMGLPLHPDQLRTAVAEEVGYDHTTSSPSLYLPPTRLYIPYYSDSVFPCSTITQHTKESVIISLGKKYKNKNASVIKHSKILPCYQTLVHLNIGPSSDCVDMVSLYILIVLSPGSLTHGSFTVNEVSLILNVFVNGTKVAKNHFHVLSIPRRNRIVMQTFWGCYLCMDLQNTA